MWITDYEPLGTHSDIKHLPHLLPNFLGFTYASHLNVSDYQTNVITVQRYPTWIQDLVLNDNF